MDSTPHQQLHLSIYLRNFVFGVEDSLVSTAGLLSGIASAGVPKTTILLTGVILIFVEAFSMGVGSFLSERSIEAYLKQTKSLFAHSFAGGTIMFFSYFVSGFVPLLPYLILNVESAFWASILLSLAALFVLGFISAKVFKANVLQNGLRMLLIGGIAIGVGVFVGNLLK